jgi:8-amino-7-oxononanoate synthase
MPALNEVLNKHAKKREAGHLVRRAHVGEEHGVMLARGDARYVSFGGNDYLGLRQDPQVVAAAESALARYGAGAGASRLISGTHPLYALLERRLAESKHAEAALVFGSGYATSLGVIPALVGKGDVIFADKLSHACMLDGALLSGAKLMRFAHNDMVHLRTLLDTHREGYRHALIMSEHVFSMDGDTAPVLELQTLKQRYDAWLMLDDAHGFGVLPSSPVGEVDIWMGTLSKAAGSYGGYVVGSHALREHLLNTARSFVFSTGLPPSVVAASAESVRVMQEESEHRQKLWRNIRYLAELLEMDVPHSAIIPIIMGDEAKALHAQAACMKAGYFVPAIRPPTVPSGRSRLRISVSALHTTEQLEGLVAQLRTLGVA